MNAAPRLRERDTRRCNTGGPMSRTRKQTLTASLLAPDAGSLRFPRGLSVGLDFGRGDPLIAVEGALRRARIPDPEQLRGRFDLPAEPCICRENTALAVPRVADLGNEDLLRQLLLLGLCTPYFYDPRRPVLFTRSSLQRRLELYVDRGFYA